MRIADCELRVEPTSRASVHDSYNSTFYLHLLLPAPAKEGLEEANSLLHARYAAQPRFVEGGPHVDAGQVGRRALDAVRHGSGQLVASVGTLQHQGSATVTLRGFERRRIQDYSDDLRVIIKFLCSLN